MAIHYRGTCIVITDKGILIGKERGGKYALIGGQCNYINGRRESRKDAAIRELKEETGLEAIIAEDLGEVITNSGSVETKHKVYLIKAKGKLKMAGNYTAISPSKELLNLGFFDLKYLYSSLPSKYQGHVYACLKHYNNEVRKGLKWEGFKSNIVFS